MRVVIAGAGGGVGASVAFNLLRGPLDCEVVMVDSRPAMVTSHLMDLRAGPGAGREREHPGGRP